MRMLCFNTQWPKASNFVLNFIGKSGVGNVIDFLGEDLADTKQRLIVYAMLLLPNDIIFIKINTKKRESKKYF